MPKLTNKMKNALNLTEDGNIHNIDYRNNSNNNNYTNDLNKFSNYKVVNLKLDDNSNNSDPYLNLNIVYINNVGSKYLDSQDVSKDKNSNNSATYLSNINEYSIKESYNPNQDRILKYHKKNIIDYNCVNGQNQSMKPPKYAVDKWPLFYEKYIKILNFVYSYYNLANKPNAFHKKDGSFTNLIEKNVVSLPIHREKIGLENVCSKEFKIKNTHVKINKSKKTPINLKFTKILDDNIPNCPLKRNYERILQNNNNNSNFKF
jgi:hypothetical protein